MRGLPNKLLAKGAHGKILRIPDFSQQPVLGIEEIQGTGSSWNPIAAFNSNRSGGLYFLVCCVQLCYRKRS